MSLTEEQIKLILETTKALCDAVGDNAGILVIVEEDQGGLHVLGDLCPLCALESLGITIATNGMTHTSDKNFNKHHIN